MKLRDCWRVALGLSVVIGCQRNENDSNLSRSPTFSGIELTIAAVDNPHLIPALNAQRGEWGASRKSQVTVRPDVVNTSSLQNVDVLVFAGERLGELVDVGALAVLPEALVRPPALPDVEGTSEPSSKPTPAEDPLKFADILIPFKDLVSKYGAERMGLPLGSSGLVLVMNKTLFNQAKIETKGPRTWKELDELAKAVHSPENPGIALAFTSDRDGVAGAIFLARAAALGLHKDQFSFLFDADSMAPRIASPPFVEALEALIRLGKIGPEGVLGFDAQAARHAFRSGKVAILIDLAERADSWAGGFPITVAPLPGSDRVYEPASKVWEELKTPNRPTYLPAGGGWLVGVAASTSGKRREAAIDFALYLAGPEIDVRVRTTKEQLMLPIRNSQLSQGLLDPKASTGVDARAWSEAVASTLTAPRIIPSLRIPESSGYLADLDKALVAAANGESAEVALRTVSQAWDERTVKLGKQRQLWHYRRSLNTLATKPQPPER